MAYRNRKTTKETIGLVSVAKLVNSQITSFQNISNKNPKYCTWREH